jgi:hypothetical protein
MMSSATAEVTPIFASNGASVTSRSSRYSSSATNRRDGGQDEQEAYAAYLAVAL